MGAGLTGPELRDGPVAWTLPPWALTSSTLNGFCSPEAAEPPLSPQDAAARDRGVGQGGQGQPRSFDGPAVACGELERAGPGVLRLSWVRVTYRHYALRRVPGATALPSLFVNVVQPTDDGRVLVVRMSPSTAAPAAGSYQVVLWSLPGRGSAGRGGTGRLGARELGEELGVAAAAEDLELWVVTRGENGSVGLTYLARPFLRWRCALTSALLRQLSAVRAENPNSTPSCCWARRTNWPVWTVRTRIIWRRSSAVSSNRAESCAGEEVPSSFVELGHAPQAPGPEPSEVAAHAEDRLAVGRAERTPPM